LKGPHRDSTDLRKETGKRQLLGIVALSKCLRSCQTRRRRLHPGRIPRKRPGRYPGPTRNFRGGKSIRNIRKNVYPLYVLSDCILQHAHDEQIRNFFLFTITNAHRTFIAQHRDCSFIISFYDGFRNTSFNCTATVLDRRQPWRTFFPLQWS
jgi:hypothetical protein